MTKGTFDEQRALREEIEGVQNILTTLNSEVRQAEMKMGESAAHYDALVKLKAFADAELIRKRKVLIRLEQAQNA